MYRESFPEFNGQEINFSIFTKGTTRLLLEENLKEYVEVFIRRIKELTGWKDLISTETDEKRENNV